MHLVMGLLSISQIFFTRQLRKL
uniref:Uncharacterized protein n=1 Tax=Rhizophora mucronata TaxID=61149 RepID=A0A2P2Q0K3_RHIMU